MNDEPLKLKKLSHTQTSEENDNDVQNEYWLISIGNIYDTLTDEATSTNQMKKQVERGQAPSDVDSVHSAHDKYSQPHVHFKDKTSLNRDGTIHDKGHGIPNPTQKVWDWLQKNG